LLLRTLGELSLVGPAGAPIPFRRKELLLLAYLARRDGGTASRAELAALHAIVGQGETVGIEPSRLRVDAAELERLSHAGKLAAAVASWAGDFPVGDDPPASGALPARSAA